MVDNFLTDDFLTDESGSVTADWVVLTAGGMALCLAAAGVVGGAIESGSMSTSKYLRNLNPGWTMVTSYEIGARGSLMSKDGPVDYSIGDFTGTDIGGGMFMIGNVSGDAYDDNKLTLNFEETNTSGIRLNLGLETQNHGGPVMANFLINGEYPDLEAMLARGEIVTNINPNALRSGVWAGSQYSRAELRGLPPDAYIEFRTNIDSFEVTGDAQSNMADVGIYMDIQAVRN